MGAIYVVNSQAQFNCILEFSGVQPECLAGLAKLVGEGIAVHSQISSGLAEIEVGGK
jgi:hypothetical protein